MCRSAGIWRARRSRPSAPNSSRQGSPTSFGRWDTGSPHRTPEKRAVGPLRRGVARCEICAGRRRWAREDSDHGGVSASGQKELTVPGDHRAAAVVLPGDDAHVGDAAPELEDLGAGSSRKRARGAQVVDAERDRLRHAFAAALVEETQQRRQLEEGAENATVHGGKRGVADYLWPDRQDALEGAVAALDLDAEEARVRDGVDDPLHSPPPFLA